MDREKCNDSLEKRTTTTQNKCRCIKIRDEIATIIWKGDQFAGNWFPNLD